MLRELFGTSKQQQKGKQSTQPQTPPKAPAAPVRVDSVLGAGTHTEGNIRAEGNIRIDGTLLGNVKTRGRIVIGEKGHLEGDLIGEAIEIAGVVKGDMIARRISVMRTGRVWGDLQLEKLATEEGCFVQGKVTMQETVDLNAYLPAKSQPQEASDPTSKPEEATPALHTPKVTQISKRQG